MDSNSTFFALTNWIDTLPDRPGMLLLFIMGGASVILCFMLVLLRLAWKLFGGLSLGGDDEMKKLAARVYGGAGPDGKIDGIPALFSTNSVSNHGSVTGYEAEFRYAVGNPQGLRLAAHRSGLLHRPLEFLPPEVADVPESFRAAGYTLRCEPPEQGPSAADRAAAFGVFAAGGDLTELSLDAGELKVRLYRRNNWTDEELRALLHAGAAAAKKFN
ncbi:MAG TPA: hypothetical protein PKI19_00580 [Elusimicrobiales bacterium]|nr:hypothetical protein [Elusimicrobiales bacterium]